MPWLMMQKMVALKKAYADIILNTAKEAAARIMVSERKALRFQHDLCASRDEALRMLVRLKQMLDSKVFDFWFRRFRLFLFCCLIGIFAMVSFFFFIESALRCLGLAWLFFASFHSFFLEAFAKFWTWWSVISHCGKFVGNGWIGIASSFLR